MRVGLDTHWLRRFCNNNNMGADAAAGENRNNSRVWQQPREPPFWPLLTQPWTQPQPKNVANYIVLRVEIQMNENPIM